MLGALIALIAVVGVKLIRKDAMQLLHIETPRDESIAVAGRPVVFSVRTDPPHLASGVRWTVTTQSGQPGANGVGASFAYTFGATGVEHIVAQGTNGLTCDVIVYVFKTPNGGSTLADLMRAEPPPVQRRADSLHRFGSRAVPPRTAS